MAVTYFMANIRHKVLFTTVSGFEGRIDFTPFCTWQELSRWLVRSLKLSMVKRFYASFWELDKDFNVTAVAERWNWKVYFFLGGGGGGISSLVQIQFCAVVTCLSSASCASHLSRHKKQGCIFRLAVNLSTDGLLLFLYSFKELHGYASCQASHPHTAFTDLHPFSRTH